MLARSLVFVALFVLTGCRSIINVSVMSVSKNANALATPLTPEAFCIALLSPNIDLTGKGKFSAPEITAEQKQYCSDVMSHLPQQKETKKAR